MFSRLFSENLYRNTKSGRGKGSTMRGRLRLLIAFMIAGLFVSLLASCTQETTHMTRHTTGIPPQSTFFATAQEESYSTYQLPGDGDLWPSCWADDDNLYTANGDGTAFSNSLDRFDMAVSPVSGLAPHPNPATP